MNSPPWDTPNAGSYEFEINVGTAALGPFATPAVLTGAASECSSPGGNTTPPNGVADTIVGIGGPAALLADTDYWIEIILRDPADVEVDRLVCGPVHTVAYPTFVCLSSGITQTSATAQIAGATGAANVTPPCNQDTVVWEIATVAGGPYTAAPSEPVATFSPQHTFTGLTPGTQYFFRARLSEQAQTAGEYLVTQECSFTTSDVVEPPVSSPFQPLPCAGDGGGAAAFTDVEHTILCDVDAGGERLATVIMVQLYDDAGVAIGVPTPHDPATGLPYVVQGTLVPCEDAGADAELEILCDIQADATSVQFIRHFVHSSGTGELLPGETFDTLPDGSPYVPTGTVGSCDPYRLCTPSSDLDLVGDCGPGETPNTVLIGDEGVASDSVINDDPTADPLCGGVWDRPSEASPFTVLETFRNATFDQPGPVTQGTPPYAGLTASPGWTGSNVDAPGQGWLQTSDINSFTNGIWQVPNPFSTADGMTAQVTFASHDGTQTPNGDGLAFVFTDGSIAPQGTAIGGGGNLGLANWQGGYVAIVLDEYGGTCSCGSGINPGGCGFCPNTISIQMAGPARNLVGCECCVIAQMSVAPHNISADTDRPNPGRLITSIIEEGGQTYVSASILWSGDTEPVVYFDRVNVTACAGPSPATLRMALYGGSGGAFRSEHEFRDATATAASSQQWRAFPIVTDPIPACVTSVRVEACVDVTFTEDTQDVGNGNPEAFLWLVNTATNTVLDRVQRSSQPSQVGTSNTMCVDATVPVAQLANLRVYVGAETRDTFGIYGSSWENLEITVAGLGCPVQPVRTLAISAPCPIDVNIIGGTADGTPAPVTVVNTPSTFEDTPVCIIVGGIPSTGFRREVRAPDGTVTVTFLGTDGLQVVPDTWRPGACPPGDTELLTICDLGTDPPTPFIRRVTFNGDGTLGTSEDLDYIGLPYVPAGLAGPCPDCGPTVLGNVCVTSPDFPGVTLPAVAVQQCDGTMTYLNPGTGQPWPNAGGVVICPPTNNLFEEILCDDGTSPATAFRRVYTLTPLGSVVISDEDLDANLYVLVGDAVRCEGGDSEFTTVCDVGSAATLLARYLFDDAGQITGTAYFALDGSGPVAPVGPLTEGGCCVPVNLGASCYDAGGGIIRRAVGERRCNPDGTPGFILFWYDTETGALVPAPTIVDCPTLGLGRDVEQQVLCDDNGPFIRAFQYGADTGTPSGAPADYTLAGAAYVPVGTVVDCGNTNGRDVQVQQLCDANGTRFLRRYVYNADTGAFDSVVNTTLDGTTPFAPVGAVGFCPVAVQGVFDTETLVLCDSTPTQFLRTLVFDSDTPGSVLVVDTTLNGVTPFAPVGAVGVCTTAAVPIRDSESFILCSSTPAPGTQFIRTRVYNELGAVTATVDTTLTGAPFVPGVVSVCAQSIVSDTDFLSQVLCDTVGPFLQLQRYNSQTGVLVSTTNLTLTGAAYVPVGAIGSCDTCCPQVIGDGCTNVGSGFYTAIRAANGTISLIDSVSGAAILTANIIACPSDNTTRTLTAQARLVADADAPWTPGADVVGTLTSVTMTVLSGTATLTDQSGTVLAGLPAGVTMSWQAEDDNVLTGPQSIDAIGGSTAVHWTQR